MTYVEALGNAAVVVAVLGGLFLGAGMVASGVGQLIEWPSRRWRQALVLVGLGLALDIALVAVLIQHSGTTP